MKDEIEEDIKEEILGLIEHNMIRTAEDTIMKYDKTDRMIQIAKEQIKEFDTQVLQKRACIRHSNQLDKASVTKFSRDISTQCDDLYTPSPNYSLMKSSKT